MSIYCTLFNSAYLSRGIAMLRSLHEHSPALKVAVVAMDDDTHAALKELSLPNVDLYSISSIETNRLKRVREERTLGEYCWTLTPFIMRYVQERYNKPVIYLDADLFFFSDLSVIERESVGSNLVITEHRFTPKYNQADKVGRFCVQYVYVANNDIGRSALERWSAQCLEWCYDKIEPERFGDQKYLDEWPKLYTGCKVSDNLGVGLAPWNIQQYTYKKNKLIHLPTRKDVIPVFYHFHALKKLASGKWDAGQYQLTAIVIEKIYRPYISKLVEIEQELGFSMPAQSNIDFIEKLKRKLRGTHNVVEV